MFTTFYRNYHAIFFSQILHHLPSILAKFITASSYLLFLRACFVVQDGSTALMYASLRSHTDIVVLLLQAGADMNAKNKVLSSKKERVPH